MKITLKDIAEDTGYSISTVSRVLSGSKKISNRARSKIIDSARRLNYPHFNNSKTHHSPGLLNVFLVVTGFHKGEFYASFFHGFNQAAENNNVQLSMISLNKSLNEICTTVHDLSHQNFDGLILFAPEFEKSDYLKISNSIPEGYPIVSNGLIETPVFSTVSFDGYSGGYLVAEHFNQKNYQQCGIIRGPLSKAEACYRANGFNDYIAQTPNMEMVWQYHGDFTFESGIHAFNSFSALENKPEAIFACNDSMCHAFMETALQEGYTFPDDIAIVGYDDLPICTRHRPTISSIHTDYNQLGEVAMGRLRETILKPEQGRGVLSLVPVTLKSRESS